MRAMCTHGIFFIVSIIIIIDRYWRSYSQDSIVQSHFSSAAVNYSVVGDALIFERQLLLSQLAAALQMKQQIETFRASNTFGTLIWQLGEIFPTGGWGSLEYAHARAGTPGAPTHFQLCCALDSSASADSTAGQILGGRWKPLHYMLESCLFKDVFVACGREGQCYVRNDGRKAINGSVSLRAVDVRSGKLRPIGVESVEINVAAGPAAFFWMCAGSGTSISPCTNWSVLLQEAGCGQGSAFNCMLEAQVLSSDGRLLASNPSLLAPASSYLSSLSSSSTVYASVDSPAPPAGAPIAITITCQAPAMCECPLR